MNPHKIKGFADLVLLLLGFLNETVAIEPIRQNKRLVLLKKQM